MGWPANGEAVIHSLSSSIIGIRPVRTVTLLGASAPVSFTQKPDGLHIQVPANPPSASSAGYAYVYRIDFADGSTHE
jgi:alpha-L-fucosidase